MNTLKTYHVWRNNQSSGPFTVRQLCDRLKEGVISSSTLIAEAGADDWLPLSSFREIMDAPAPAQMNEPDSTIVVDAPRQPMSTNAVIIACSLVICGTIVFSAFHITASQEAVKATVKNEVEKLRDKFERSSFYPYEIPLVEIIRGALKEK